VGVRVHVCTLTFNGIVDNYSTTLIT